jgi:hypothetical protein
MTLIAGYRFRLRATLAILIAAVVIVWLLYVGVKGGGCQPHC